MPQFMLLIENGDFESLSEQQQGEIITKYIAWVRAMRENNQFVAGDELKPGGKRLIANGNSVVDGPYAETKESIGGYMLIEAASLDQASDIAKGCPTYGHGGAVQVKELNINEE